MRLPRYALRSSTAGGPARVADKNGEDENGDAVDAVRFFRPPAAKKRTASCVLLSPAREVGRGRHGPAASDGGARRIAHRTRAATRRLTARRGVSGGAASVGSATRGFVAIFVTVG